MLVWEMGAYGVRNTEIDITLFGEEVIRGGDEVIVVAVDGLTNLGLEEPGADVGAPASKDVIANDDVVVLLPRAGQDAGGNFGVEESVDGEP